MIRGLTHGLTIDIPRALDPRVGRLLPIPIQEELNPPGLSVRDDR